jgi:long-chain acyl-CoA synthetase
MPGTLSDEFLAAAREHADRPAVLHESGSISYAELAAGVELVAGRLQELGLAGSRVGIMIPNLPVFPLLLFGAQRAGCSTLLLNPLNSRREVAEYLGTAAVSTVITAAPLAPLLPHGTTGLLVDSLPRALRLVEGAEPREIPLRGAPPVVPVERGPDDEAAVLFTAATNGWARGAVLTHRNLLANLRSTHEAMLMTPEDRVVGALPYIHAFGLTVTLTAPLTGGAAVIPVERFRAPRLLADLEHHEATIFAGVPAMYLGILAAAGRGEPPRHSLRLAISGGAQLPMEASHAFREAFSLELRQGYGLTEAGPVCLFNRVDRPNAPGTLGSPFPQVQVSIRDLDGSELPDGEVGELCVRGDNVFHGYLGEGGRQPRDFHDDWLRTGDLASRLEDRTVRFRGVFKPMFTRNGFNIYPRELERVLAAAPGIREASVYSQPDPLRENEIVLRLALERGSELDEEAIRSLCRDRLAAYKQPGRIDLHPAA